MGAGSTTFAISCSLSLALNVYMVLPQAMREIINDRRYGVLRTLGERKQAFNEVTSFYHITLQIAK